MVDNLETGKYYFRKSTNETMRYDGWVMQLWFDDWADDVPRIGWDDVPPLSELEEVTWGTKAIPLQDFSDCEHY